ncbi:MAG: GIY-YIG nuclease family protein [Saprospiraceae bacterium]|nr:GIY-YIG nuclease family protein [Saprospiraceae bacterium]MBK9632298.1 GIY-YIG nuclease family protein [Saprospiraceae bacterium]
MEHYVYIIESEMDGTFYKGYSLNPLKRLEAHNEGETEFSAMKIPWKLVFLQSYASKKEALIRERALKKYSRSQIEQLLLSTKNELNKE